jgi:hypothetical protein
MSDTTDLSIIIVLVIGLIVYIHFIKRIIYAKYDINNIKCNPVNLFLKSINADTTDSINNFAECVQLLNPSTSTNTSNDKNNFSINELFK